jgi:hypothetical protein
MPRVRLPYLVLGVVAGIGVAIGAVLLLGGGSTSGNGAAIPAQPPTTAHVPQPAGPNPSESAQMVCAPEAQKDIAKFLGQPTTAVTAPTWLDHRYSCQYTYPNGVIALSVKELSNKAETTAYFSNLRAQLGEQEHLKGFAQGAFVTTNSSLVLRKDYKVLLVDTSELPKQFGSPPQGKKDVAIGIGLTVLGCWTGA